MRAEPDSGKDSDEHRTTTQYESNVGRYRHIEDVNSRRQDFTPTNSVERRSHQHDKTPINTVIIKHDTRPEREQCFNRSHHNKNKISHNHSPQNQVENSPERYAHRRSGGTCRLEISK